MSKGNNVNISNLDKNDPDEISVDGIIGNQFEARGWERHTTGVGGDLGVRLGHSQGVESFDMNTKSIETPLRLGRFIGVWLRKPPFFDEYAKKVWDYFFQDKILEFSGLTDNSIDKLSRTQGAVKRTEEFIGNYNENNNNFTLKIPEVKGSPVRKLLNYYINAVSDSTTGISHYHGKKNMRHELANYTGDFMYILLGNSMRPDDIEFACTYFYAFPNIDLLGHLNSGEIGDPGSADLSFDVEFSGMFARNNSINKAAQQIVEASGYYKDTNEDIILPTYFYNTFKGNNTELFKSKYAASRKERLENAATSDSDTGASISESNTAGRTDVRDSSLTVTVDDAYDSATAGGDQITTTSNGEE